MSCIKALFSLSFITLRETDVWPGYVLVSETCGGQHHYVWTETSNIDCRYYSLMKGVFSLSVIVTHSGAFIPPTERSQLLWCVKQSRWMTDVFGECCLNELGYTVMACASRTRHRGSKTEAGAVPVNIHIQATSSHRLQLKQDVR